MEGRRRARKAAAWVLIVGLAGWPLIVVVADLVTGPRTPCLGALLEADSALVDRIHGLRPWIAACLKRHAELDAQRKRREPPGRDI